MKIVEFCGFRQKKINYFDDFHINFLNERISLQYTNSVLRYEKIIFENEGLEKFFPTVSTSFLAKDIIKLIDNIRKPPGVYQILETVNKMGQTNNHLLNNIRKFLGNSNLLDKDRLNKNYVYLNHSFGKVLYDFQEFVTLNYYVLPENY